MPSGSCLCGKVAYEYSGNPITTAVCHCTDCQKWGGAGYSSNLAISTDALRIIAGSPAKYARKGLSGQDHVLAFCGACGTSLYSQPTSMGTVTLIKTGALNDVAVRDLQVANELFVKDRLNYDTAIASAVQNIMGLGGPTV